MSKSIIVVGNQSSGKSTLISHLKYIICGLDNYLIKKVGKELSKIINSYINYAREMHKLNCELERNATFDSKMEKITIFNSEYIFIDTPGHIDFVKNMMYYIHQADITIVCITVQHVLGNNYDSLSLKSLLIALKSFGTKYIIFAINKIDSIYYKYSKYDYACQLIKDKLDEIQYYNLKYNFIPISSNLSDNLNTKSNDLKWYNDKPLINQLIDYNIIDESNIKTLIMPITNVFRTADGVVLLGKIIYGTLSIDTNVWIAPIHKPTRIINIFSFGRKLDLAKSGMIIGVLIDGDKEDFNYQSAHVLSNFKEDFYLNNKISKIHVYSVKQLIVKLTNCHEPKIGSPMKYYEGYSPLICIHSRISSCRFNRFYKEFKNIEENVSINSIECRDNETFYAELLPKKEIVVDIYEKFPVIGSLIVRDGRVIISYGQIIHLIYKY